MRVSNQRVPFLTHLHLRNWRNFIEAAIDPGRRAILVGPNAAGKTNLLDVARFLRDVASEGVGFQEAVRRRGGVQRLRCLAARQFSDLGVLVRIGAGEETAEWEYELQFNQEKQPKPVIKRERLAHLGEDLVIRPDREDEADPERLRRTALEQAGTFKDFRGLAAFFESIRYVNIVPRIVRDPGHVSAGAYDPFGGDLIERMAQISEKSRNSRLRHIVDALRPAVRHLMELDVVRDPRGRPHLRARHGHWRAKGAWHEEDQFSDGTLRLVGLLWETLDGDGPLLIEEPEISLHAEIARLLPGVLSRLQRRTGRQVILSTHSTELLRADGIRLDEILLLIPGHEGTEVRPAMRAEEVQVLLDTGLGPAATSLEEGATAAEDRQMGLFAG